MQEPEPGRTRPACLALDIGGSKLAAAVVDGTGAVRVGARVPTPRTDDPEVLFSAVADLLGRVLDEGRQTGLEPPLCGVGCGGPMGPGGEEVSPLNIPAWRGFPLRSRVEALVGRPTAVDNDAKALALAEGWVGAGAGHDDYIAMVVSTGVGGGIVLDGRLLDGAAGNAGHIGHVVVVPSGARCACGGRGCLEAEASGLAIERATGRPAAEAGPEVVARVGMLVGRAVAGAANLLDLGLAVVGGSVALGFGSPFFSAARREVERRARLEFSRHTRIIPSALGAHGGLIGAAAVAHTRL
ncbi:MAG TPA: ROK family protein [Acidimicrobiales bacterium]|nr:ROK family protein [Acidimicrobiales bacterium]